MPPGRDQALEDIVLNEVKKIKLKKIKSQKKKPDNLSGSIELSIKKIDNAISKLLDTYAFTGMPENVLEEKITALAKQREDLLFQLDNLKPCLSQKEIEDCFSSFDEAFKSNDISALRTVLHQLIERIEVDDDDVSISWRF